MVLRMVLLLILTLLAMVLFGFASFVAVGLLAFGRFETIPYSKRRHFVVLRPSWEKELGELAINMMKEKKLKDSMLPDTHADTIRIRAITKDLIWALERSLEQDHVSNKGNASRYATILDKKSKKQKRQSTVSHLNDLEWEILVVDEPIANGVCLPGGKIVVFTGLLKHFRSNAELATIIGHEVGHAIARHSAETLTNDMWLILVRLTFLLGTGDLLSFLSIDGKDNSNILEFLWKHETQWSVI